MLRNYFLVAIRNLLRHKVYSLINISGLALGMACCLLIFSALYHQWSFDRFHAHRDTIFRLITRGVSPAGDVRFTVKQPVSLAAALKEAFPEVLRVTRFSNSSAIFRHGDRLFRERIALVDPAYLHMFTYPLVAGDANTALQKLKSVVISEPVARKYFGEEIALSDLIGQTLSINGRLNYVEDYVVTGILKTLPPTSSLQSNAILIPFDNFRQNDIQYFGVNYPTQRVGLVGASPLPGDSPIRATG